MKVEGRAKKVGEGRERGDFVSFLSSLSSFNPFFLLSFELTTNKRGNACYVGYYYTNTAAFSLFWKTCNTAPATHMETFIGAFYSSIPLQRVLRFLLHWITGEL